MHRPQAIHRLGKNSAALAALWDEGSPLKRSEEGAELPTSLEGPGTTAPSSMHHDYFIHPDHGN